MKIRNLPSVSSGPMADIAFLLLIFFIIATSIENEKGIIRKLPIDSGDELNTKKRNTFLVRINNENKLLVQNNEMPLSELRHATKEFIENPACKENLPEKEIININPIGNIYVTKNHIISLQNDRGTTYAAYIAVQNELTAAYNELRDEFAQKQFGKAFAELDDGYKEAVEKVYPLRISESEPKEIGGK